jgi:hypothetical protein
LQDLLIQAPQIQAAAVVSFDGLPMASALPVGMDEDRVAAMSAALLSLGERAAVGLGRGELSQVYVEGNNGTVFLVSADDEAVLVAVAAKGAKVGLMLFEAKQAAVAVAEALRAEDALVAPRTESVSVPVVTVPEPVVPDPTPSTAVHVPVGDSAVAESSLLPPPAPEDLVEEVAPLAPTQTSPQWSSGGWA